MFIFIIKKGPPDVSIEEDPIEGPNVKLKRGHNVQLKEGPQYSMKRGSNVQLKEGPQ